MNILQVDLPRSALGNHWKKISFLDQGFQLGAVSDSIKKPIVPLGEKAAIQAKRRGGHSNGGQTRICNFQVFKKSLVPGALLSGYEMTLVHNDNVHPPKIKTTLVHALDPTENNLGHDIPMPQGGAVNPRRRLRVVRTEFPVVLVN